MGRPSSYTEERAAGICALVAAGSNLSRICVMEDMPDRATVYLWFRQNPSFLADYVRAREERADVRSEDIDTIIDEVRAGALDPNAARIAIDALKWQAGKESPRRYGDRTATEISGPNGAPIQSEHRIVFVTPEPK